MKIDPANIVSILSQRRTGMSSRELLRALHLAPTARHTFHRVLRDMERQGVLRRVRGGKYLLAGEGRVNEGIVVMSRRGDGRIHGNGGPSIRIPSRLLAGAADGDRVRFVLLPKDRMGRTSGKILGIVERSTRPVVGMFQRGREHDFALPIDAAFNQPIALEESDISGLTPGDWIVIRPNPDPGRPTGTIAEILGSPENPRVEMMAIACRHGIPLRFAADVLDEAQGIDDTISPEDLSGRVDQRNLPFITIDGQDARDFDDAVTVRTEGDRVRLFVAIADVSHYVAAGGPIDRSALQRGTSVYFPGFCIPMLPEQLSNDVCSLRPDAERLVMTAEILFSRQGDRLESEFYPAVIRSRARMTYHEVQGHLDRPEDRNGPGQQEHLRQLPIMLDLSRQLTRKRMQRGSLDLDLPEPAFEIDEAGYPVAVEFAQRLESNRLIEEFMLAANEAVAAFLASRGRALVYRIHEPPSMSDFQELNHYLASRSLPPLSFDHDLHPDLQKLVNAISDGSERRIVSRLLLQSLKQARYSTRNVGHFGLAADLYCHFTSPIRRYPDLVVHRILKETLLGNPESVDREKLEEMAEQSSVRERVAVDAERETDALQTCRFMQDKTGQVFPGHVSTVRSFGFYVELDDFPVEGLVHVSRLDDDYYHFNEQAGELVGERTGNVYRVGMSLQILVENVNMARREIDFLPVRNRREKAPGHQPGRRRGRRRA